MIGLPGVASHAKFNTRFHFPNIGFPFLNDIWRAAKYSYGDIPTAFLRFVDYRTQHFARLYGIKWPQHMLPGEMVEYEMMRRSWIAFCRQKSIFGHHNMFYFGIFQKALKGFTKYVQFAQIVGAYTRQSEVEIQQPQIDPKQFETPEKQMLSRDPEERLQQLDELYGSNTARNLFDDDGDEEAELCYVARQDSGVSADDKQGDIAQIQSVVVPRATASWNSYIATFAADAAGILPQREY